MYSRIVAGFIFLVCMQTVAGESMRNTMLFSCPVDRNLPVWNKLFDIYTEAFDRLGYDFDMVYIEGKREYAQHLNFRRYDGTCTRIKAFSKHAKNYNMTLVDTPIAYVTTSVWTHIDNNRKLESVLATEAPVVGYVRGNTITESILKSYPRTELVAFRKEDPGIISLAVGRIDYWIGLSTSIPHIAKLHGIGEKIKKQEDLRKDYLYPFVSNKHTELIPEIEFAIRSISIRNGELVH